MQKTKTYYPYIVADIGGTNARYALVTGVNPETGQFTVSHQRTYPSSEFDGLLSATQFYINSLHGIELHGACIAVAGPVANDEVMLTNLNWKFSIRAMTESLKLPRLEVINDFAASAYATPHVAKQHLKILNPGTAIESCPIAVVGPGTGFGVAALVPQSGRWNVLATEGGHMTLAAKTPLQTAIIEVLNKEFSHVSVEKVLSGPGLWNLYHGLAKVEAVPTKALSTAEISQLGVTGKDALCARTMALFASWFGTVTGDLALSLGARGGVYLGGGILPRIVDFMLQSEFSASFVDKVQMHEYLQQIPVYLVTEGNSALLGAAAWFEKP